MVYYCETEMADQDEMGTVSIKPTVFPSIRPSKRIAPRTHPEKEKSLASGGGIGIQSLDSGTPMAVR